MEYYKFILGVLAVWRLTHLLAAEDGPFHLLAHLRARAGTGFWASLMDCFYCLSLWTSAPFAALLAGAWRERLLLWPALSGAAILVNRLAERIAPEAPIFIEQPFGIEEENHELLRTTEGPRRLGR
ncbi:MAG: hypothetical protein LAP87_15180 [Acidobacteriia bacterium]|nr:hypothetical protein [Terriglobia bacterium]